MAVFSSGIKLDNTGFALYFYRPDQVRGCKKTKIMNLNELILKPEEEMDFLPIIPLNENEENDMNGIVVPDEIAICD